ncbi:hypothetical protein QTP88_007642 [Uroleucon formosanum]
MSSSEDDEKYWIHPYIQNNINCRIFVAANELMQDDVKFQYSYRIKKESKHGYCSNALQLQLVL